VFAAAINQYGFVGFVEDTDLDPDVTGFGVDKGADQGREGEWVHVRGPFGFWDCFVGPSGLLAMTTVGSLG
jgi:hypothetical protein